MTESSIPTEYDAYWVVGIGFCGPQWRLAEAARYGAMTRAAIQFAVQNNSFLEQQCAVLYARAAAHHAHLERVESR